MMHAAAREHRFATSRRLSGSCRPARTDVAPPTRLQGASIMTMKLTIRLVTSVLSLTTTALAADPAKPVGETVADVFYEGLERRRVAERYAAHEAFAAARFEASRGGKTFSDKTGNCRLAWVEQLITKQVDSIGEADRFTRELLDAAA